MCIRRLRVDRRAIFKLEKKANNRKLPIPSPCRVQDALEMYCDFNGLVRVKLLKVVVIRVVQLADPLW